MTGCPDCKEGIRHDGLRCVRCDNGDLYAMRLLRSYRLGVDDAWAKWGAILARIPSMVAQFEKPNPGWEDLREEIEAAERADEENADRVLTQPDPADRVRP